LIKTTEEAAEPVEKLWKAIRYHDHRYYVENAPVISDAEYDRLFQALQTLESRFPQLESPESPTQRVGGEPWDELGMVEHPRPMLSLRAGYAERQREHGHVVAGPVAGSKLDEAQESGACNGRGGICRFSGGATRFGRLEGSTRIAC
jgi:NAD-dependent DNA ligase